MAVAAVAAAAAKADVKFLHRQVLYREPSVGATGSTAALEPLVSALSCELCKASRPGGGSSTVVGNTILLLIPRQPFQFTISTTTVAGGTYYILLLLCQQI